VKDHFHDGSLNSSGGEAIGRREFLNLMIAASLFARDGFAQTAEDTRARFRRMSEETERRGLAEPFKGITSDGAIAHVADSRLAPQDSRLLPVDSLRELGLFMTIVWAPPSNTHRGLIKFEDCYLVRPESPKKIPLSSPFVKEGKRGI
jgi:hypothetical protein